MPQKNSRSSMVKVLIIVFLLLILGVGVFVVANQLSNNQSAQNSKASTVCPDGSMAKYVVTTYANGAVSRSQDFVMTGPIPITNGSSTTQNLGTFTMNSSETGIKIDYVRVNYGTMGTGFTYPNKGGTSVYQDGTFNMSDCSTGSISNCLSGDNSAYTASVYGDSTQFCTDGLLRVDGPSSTNPPPPASVCPTNGTSKFVVTTYKNGAVARTQDFVMTGPIPITNGQSQSQDLGSFSLNSDETGVKIDYVRSNFGTMGTGLAYPNKGGTSVYQDGTFNMNDCSTSGNLSDCITGPGSAYLANIYGDSTQYCIAGLVRVLAASQANPPPPSCQTLWWLDNNDKTCSSQKQFCGAYSYAGLQTFNTQQECLNAVTPTIVTSVTCGAMDSNSDGKLDLIDFAAFAKVFGKSCNDSQSTFGTCGGKDSNKDGKIDVIDFANLAKKIYVTQCQ